MNPLWIYFNSSNQVNLSGEDAGETVIAGCRYAPGSGVVTTGGQPGLQIDTITETLDLVLKGTWDAICAKVYRIEMYLEQARLEPIRKDWVYLRFYNNNQGAETVYDWRSRILGGRVEFGSKGIVDRDTESQHVKLTITRLNYWFKPRCLAPVFYPGLAEPDITNNAQTLYAHDDSPTHKTSFGLCGHVSEGDLPSPVELVFENTLTADPICSLTVVQRVLRGTLRSDLATLEGESLTAGSGGTKTTTADAGSSGGNFGRLAWSGTSEVQLATWSPTAAQVNILRGQVQRGLVRLANAAAYTDLWVCVKLLYPGTSTVLAESLWSLVPAGTKYIELPPSAIPPGLAGVDSYQGVTVGLYARRATAGSHQLDVDFMQWSPAERIRRLTDLTGGLLAGDRCKLVDSGIEETTYFTDLSSSRATTHVGSGEYLAVIPGYDSMVRVLHRAGGDAAWTIGVALDVTAYYEPRRKNL